MARRMILGRRGSAYGLWISKPGFDALAASDAQLLFTMTQRAGMVLSSGSVTVPAGGSSLRVAFGETYPSVPLVFCGNLTNYPSNRTVNVVADTSGFTLRPVQEAYGDAWPAAGTAARWFAVMKTET
jgi:hypothetical protein